MNKFKFEYFTSLFHSANRRQKIAAAMFMTAKFTLPFAVFVMWMSRYWGAAMIGVYASLVWGTVLVCLYDWQMKRWNLDQLTVSEGGDLNEAEPQVRHGLTGALKTRVE